MNTNTVLIADDDRDVLKMMERTLTDDRTEVLGVTDGLSLLKCAYGELPDLIILDVTMPGVNGIDVCIALRKGLDTRNVPILMMTGAGDLHAADCLVAGADAYITKPFDVSQLKARVDGLMQGARA